MIDCFYMPICSRCGVNYGIDREGVAPPLHNEPECDLFLSVILKERERIAKLIEGKVMPKEYEGVAGFQPWKKTVEDLASEIRKLD